MTSPKNLTLDTKNSKIFGVCAGLSNYFNLDVSVIRLVMVAITLVTAVVPGVLFYIIAALIIPKEGN